MIGDVHGNLPALEAVIANADGAAEWLCAGDTVGYGPYPNECLRRIEDIEAMAVAGNHDLVSRGRLDLSSFNREARLACEWTREVLVEASCSYLDSLATMWHTVEWRLVHGSPRNPLWEYVVSVSQARASFLEFEEAVCFHGHSHVPAVFRLSRESFPEEEQRVIALAKPRDGDVIELEEGHRFMVNAGSVGQPRDGDPRACYVEFDRGRGTITYRRVEYPIADVQKRMSNTGLPALLIERLAAGR